MQRVFVRLQEAHEAVIFQAAGQPNMAPISHQRRLSAL